MPILRSKISFVYQRSNQAGNEDIPSTTKADAARFRLEIDLIKSQGQTNLDPSHSNIFCGGFGHRKSS